MVAQSMHQGFADYLTRNNVGRNAGHDDGSFHLVFDNQYRVAFLTGSGGTLWLESRVCELPENPTERQALLMRLLERAGNEIFLQTACLTLPKVGNLLIVQQLVPAEAGVQEFMRFLENFLNLLASYRSLAGVL